MIWIPATSTSPHFAQQLSYPAVLIDQSAWLGSESTGGGISIGVKSPLLFVSGFGESECLFGSVLRDASQSERVRQQGVSKDAF